MLNQGSCASVATAIQLVETEQDWNLGGVHRPQFLLSAVSPVCLRSYSLVQEVGPIALLLQLRMALFCFDQ